MFACVDVHYKSNRAQIACLTFNAWQCTAPKSKYAIIIKHFEEYVPGQFYKRELPCILEIFDKVEEDIRVLVIDGYVWLDEKRMPGLGAHVYNALRGQVKIIGVAKSAFKGASLAKKVFRNGSKKPLFVASVGISPACAALIIQKMHGSHRIPTLLKLVDQLSRNGI